ncbi:MAG: LCP family protein [Streptosporangiaceae bacterium]|nr:LCP family protein [Streptosporangiaceae bacterium]MBV9857330.1 LCP family protein [Streptosporangiaceae bacterium]
MSDWPEGWYRDEPGRASFRAEGRTDEAPPTVASGQAPPTVTNMDGSARPGRPSAWPEQPPVTTPERAVPGTGRPGLGGRRWRFWGQPGRRGRRIALIAALVVVVLIVATAGSYFWLDSKLNRSVTLPAFAGQSAGQNWLITGSDTRRGLSRRQIDALHVGFNFGTTNSDSIMLLHMGGGRPVLISIPRDSYVPIPGHGTNKINAALGFGGPELLIQTVESVTGLHIDHYMGIGFGGLVSVVNEVGGVRICLPTALHDSYSGLNLSAGCHNLNGTQALGFVRDRHSFADSDLQRMQDQRAFLRALLAKATGPGVYLNPFTALPFGSSAAGAISVDKGTHLYDLVQAAFALRNPQTATVPIADPAYITPNAGEAVLWNHTQAVALFSALKNGQTVPPNLLTGTKVG